MNIRSFKRHFRAYGCIIGLPTIVIAVWFIRTIYTDAEQLKLDMSKTKQNLKANTEDEELKLPVPNQLKHDIKICTRMSTDKLALDDIMNMPKLDFLPKYKNPCFKDGLTGELKCLPYFMLLGAAKSGTTDMFFKIMKHPDVVNNTGDLNGKETLWWCWKRFGYGYYWYKDPRMESFQQYLSYFNNAASVIKRRVDALGFHNTVTGDGTALDLHDFTGWPQIQQNVGLKEPKILTPHLIKHISPDTKFLLIFRDPVERLYSDFSYWHFTQPTSEEFHKQVVHSLNLLQECQSKYGLRYCLYSRELHCNMTTRVYIGIYWIYLKEWFNVFPRNQFLILRTEDISASPKSTLKAVFKFLKLRDVEESVLDEICSRKPLYKTKSKTEQILNKTRNLLEIFYKPHNMELEKILQDSKFRWTY